jgi:hypothetical protein
MLSYDCMKVNNQKRVFLSNLGKITAGTRNRRCRTLFLGMWESGEITAERDRRVSRRPAQKVNLPDRSFDAIQDSRLFGSPKFTAQDVNYPVKSGNCRQGDPPCAEAEGGSK